MMGKHDDLLMAVRKSDLQALTKLLGKHQGSKSKLIGSGKKLNINQLDATGSSPLHQAAISGNLEIASALLEYGALADVVDHKGIRPLHLAVSGGHLELVKLLIVQHGSSVNSPSKDDVTPLHIACQQGQLHMVEVLLFHGADPTVFNSLRKAPIDLACENGHEAIVDLLLASPESPCVALLKSRDNKAQSDLYLTSCLHLASANGHANIVRRLLDRGCDINRCTREGTGLHVAVASGHLDVVTLLLDRGIDVLRVNSHKQTALDISCRLPASRENVQLKQLIQKSVAEQLSAKKNTDGIYGETPTGRLTCCGCSSSSLIISAANQDCPGCSCHTSQSVKPLQPVYQVPTSVQPVSVAATHPVPDVVLNCANSAASNRRPSDSVLIERHNNIHKNETSVVSQVSRFIVAPIRSTDFSQNCGSIVLHASFDSTDTEPHLQAQNGSVQPVMKPVTFTRSRSPDDQITPCDGSVVDGVIRCTDSPGSSSTSGASSCSGSSGFSGSGSQNPNLTMGMPLPSAISAASLRQHRLSGHSCESGVVSSCPSSRLSYLSIASSSSHSSLNRLPEDNESAYCSVVSFSEFYDRGYAESEIVHTWLAELHLEGYLPLFINAGYDMPTISRMTPEDLTAIGITQPADRKKLTAEISRLHTCIADLMPNYCPNNVRDLLRLLRLEEYCETLSRDGYYSDLSKFMEITWEDLEEIGITKLGHQKKIMLAISRLKKLKQSNHRMPVEDQSSLMPASFEYTTPSRLLQVTRDGRHHTPPSASPGYRCSPKIDARFTFDNKQTAAYLSTASHRNEGGHAPIDSSLFFRPAPSPGGVSGSQAEMVAIQVKRTPAMDSTPETSSVGVGGSSIGPQFGGSALVAQQDMHTFLTKPEHVERAVVRDSRQLLAGSSCGGVTSSSSSRARHSSGGTPFFAGLSPVQNGNQTVDVGGGRDVSPWRHESTGGLNSANQPSGRRVPPAPPQRTNSIKVVDAFSTDRGKMESPVGSSMRSYYATASLGRKKASCGNALGDVGAELHVAVSNGNLTQNVHDVADSFGSDFDFQTLKLAKGSAGNSSQLSLRSNDSSGAGDCGTLPFANENIGTIRPRASSSAADTHAQTTASSSSFDYDTHTLRRRGHKKNPIKSENNPYAQQSVVGLANNSNEMASEVSVIDRTDLTAGAIAVFDDIENMFHGLTNELNELLTQPQ